MNPLLQLVDATLHRPGNFTLPNLNWALLPDQHWAIIGPSGSGKSLILDVLAGNLAPLTGQRLNRPGTPVELVARDYSFDWRIAAAAQFYQQRFNTQTANLGPTLRDLLQGQIRPVGTIDPASVLLPPPAYPAGQLAAVTEQLDIGQLLDRPLTSLSNGETRRALLARSLLKNPRVLLLDNPFSGLDTQSRAKLHETIQRVIQLGIALVMVVDERDVPAGITHRWVLSPPANIEQVSQSAPSSLSSVAGKAPTFDYAVSMRGVTVRYGDKTVLDSVDWQVRRGEKWALLGPNGSGKSTLLSLITADNPQAYANDFDLFDRRRGTGESIWAIKQHIGFISPELHLYFPRQTKVWDVVASGLFDTMGLFRKLSPAQTTQVAHQLQQLGLQALHQQPLHRLSAGQQRWVLLGRALLKNPPLLVLDEPTQGLDPTQTGQFRQLIDTLCTQNPAQTLIYVTHYPDELPRCITHTLQLDKGRVVR